MRIFLAGATGALGRRLVPQLIAAGHTVVGSTRTKDKFETLARAGAEPVVMDGLDAGSVRKAVLAAEPEVVIHQLTALTGAGNLKKFDQDFAQTNRLRTDGLDHLLEAARAAGAKRFIAQSYAGWPNERSGSAVKDETVPLDANPTKQSRQTHAAIAYLEQAVPAADIDGVVLRYGTFYGPGTGFAPDGELAELVRKRKLPVVGGGGGVWSFVHLDDAASATVRALDHGEPGVYNIVDDDPAAVAAWLPYLAGVLEAKPPMKLPAWLARPLIGEHGVSVMTQVRGSSNAKARRALGWEPGYPSWRDGFRAELGRRVG